VFRVGRFVYNKWLKTIAIVKDEAIAPHVPDTVKCSRDGLKEMLKAYKMVYIKPVVGMHGKGVMRVEQYGTSEGKRRFKFQNGKHIGRFDRYDDLYRALSEFMGRRTYLAQKGIHMLKFDDRDFDIRVMIQRNPEMKWEATAEIGRVAHPEKVVTNVHSGGALKPADWLLKPYMKAEQRRAFIAQLRELGLKVAHAMQKRFPGVRELGLDIAIDKNLKPWIIEVNTTPDPYIFRKLKNKRIFEKVFRYYKFNRRRKAR